ncbi:MAG: helix-turn-helix domain-containing protein [Nitriliruptorales bacterium]|nr:helix-turn-helix domain-containing protein [Nitriliruptorales bacterium]
MPSSSKRSPKLTAMPGGDDQVLPKVRHTEAALVCRILAVFSSEYVSELPLRDVARRLDVNPGTIHRAMTTLSNHGLLTFVNDKYHLGPVVESLAIQGSGVVD